MFKKSIRALFSIKSVHTLNRTFLVSFLVFTKIATRNILCKNVRTTKRGLDKGESVGAIFMDRSTVFDTLNHDILITKLEAYEFSKNSLTYIQSYLRNSLQRTNVKNNFSLWKNVFASVPQGSIYYIKDIFPFLNNIYLNNYADDTNLYSIGKKQYKQKHFK